MFGRNKDKKQLGLKPKEVTTLIGEGSIVEGDISCPLSIRLDGHVKGNVKAKGSVIVGEKSVVTGIVKAIEVMVYGKVEGGVEAQRLEIKKYATVSGDVITRHLTIEEDGFFNGRCIMERSSERYAERIAGYESVSVETKPAQGELEAKNQEHI
ncbi:MAG: bactofilin family protein [Deltaproteobacteria bacterium]